MSIKVICMFFRSLKTKDEYVQYISFFSLLREFICSNPDQRISSPKVSVLCITCKNSISNEELWCNVSHNLYTEDLLKRVLNDNSGIIFSISP